MSYKIGAVDSAIAVLEAVAQNPSSGVTQLAELTGKTKSQAFRLLYTLEERGYVLKDPETAGYTLGHRALLLGEAAKRQTDLVRVAQPVMAQLSDETRETTHLVIREGINSVCIAKVEGPLPLRLYAEIGRRGPLHAGGGSVVMLAFAPPDVQDAVFASELERHTPQTVLNRPQLEQALASIRRLGYHVALSDLDDGAFSIAAPIRDHLNQVVAAVSVAGPEFRLTPDAKRQHLASVLRAASRISRLLGAPEALRAPLEAV